MEYTMDHIDLNGGKGIPAASAAELTQENGRIPAASAAELSQENGRIPAASEAELTQENGRKRRVGILGGTFDPIHTAHLIIAEAAYDAFSLDEVLLMPSGHSYLKDNRAQKVLPPEIRYAIVCEAAADNPHFTASDFEMRRTGNTYTCETLRELRRQHPENHYYFIMGADSVRDILTWRDPEGIFANCTILAALREDGIPTEDFLRQVEHLRRDYGADIHTLEIPAIGISSTDIRKRVKSGRTIHYLVPDRVERYIIETGIYR